MTYSCTINISIKCFTASFYVKPRHIKIAHLSKTIWKHLRQGVIIGCKYYLDFVMLKTSSRVLVNPVRLMINGKEGGREIQTVG